MRIKKSKLGFNVVFNSSMHDTQAKLDNDINIEIVFQSLHQIYHITKSMSDIPRFVLRSNNSMSDAYTGNIFT